jgi:hypothetical protein
MVTWVSLHVTDFVFCRKVRFTTYWSLGDRKEDTQIHLSEFTGHCKNLSRPSASSQVRSRPRNHKSATLPYPPMLPAKLDLWSLTLSCISSHSLTCSYYCSITSFKSPIASTVVSARRYFRGSLKPLSIMNCQVRRRNILPIIKPQLITQGFKTSLFIRDAVQREGGRFQIPTELR